MSNTEADILSRMKSRLKYPASKMEGSFTADNLQSVATELGRIYSEDYNLLLDRAHTITATGEDLDVAAQENHGMTRKEASYEMVNLTFTGEPGTPIDSTVGAYVDNITFMVSGQYVIGADGTVDATAICTYAGAGYSVPANTVVNLLMEYEGISAVTNQSKSAGGYDRETDADFKQRIQEYEADVPGYGNIAWYRATAKEVSGVDKAKVFDVARGNGTVDVVIIANGNVAASKVLIQRVADHIEEERLAGADVLVESGTAFSIQVSATVYIDEDASLSGVTAEFKEKLSDYLDSIAFSSSQSNSRVSFAKVSELLINCDGVTDIGELKLNDAAASVECDARSFPVADDVTVTLAE